MPSTPAIEPFEAAAALAPAYLERAIEAFNAGWAEWSPLTARSTDAARRQVASPSHEGELGVAGLRG